MRVGSVDAGSSLAGPHVLMMIRTDSALCLSQPPSRALPTGLVVCGGQRVHVHPTSSMTHVMCYPRRLRVFWDAALSRPSEQPVGGFAAIMEVLHREKPELIDLLPSAVSDRLLKAAAEVRVAAPV